MKVRTLFREVSVNAPIEEVFAFFAHAENLERLTPEYLRFEILTPMPIEMREGALIEYRLGLFGIPFRWVTKITVWEPGVRFVDMQASGPYKLWEHEHQFEAAGRSTIIRDRLRYAVPGGFLEDLVFWLFVRRQILRIFNHRESEIKRIFAAIQVPRRCLRDQGI